MVQLSHSKLWAVAAGSSPYEGKTMIVFVESYKEG